MTDNNRLQRCKATLAKRRYLSATDARWVVGRLEAYQEKFGVLETPEPEVPESKPEPEPEPINPRLQFLDGIREAMKERNEQ